MHLIGQLAWASAWALLGAGLTGTLVFEREI